MNRLRPLVFLVIVAAAGYGAYGYLNRPPTSLTLTGIVTTNDVIVSPQIAGQIERLLVKEGDEVKKDQLIAVLKPDELKAETAVLQSERRGLVVTSEGIRGRAAVPAAPARGSDRPGRVDARVVGSAGEGRGRRSREHARHIHADAESFATGRGLPAGTGSGENELQFRAGEARRAQQAGRGAAGSRGARPDERGAGDLAAKPGPDVPSTCRLRPRPSVRRPTSGSATRRSSRRWTASWTCAPCARANTSTRARPSSR